MCCYEMHQIMRRILYLKVNGFCGVPSVLYAKYFSTTGTSPSNPQAVMETRHTIFSGIQPTGCLHIGNYLGAVRKWVEIQDRGEDCIFCIVDLHAITLPHEHLNLKDSILKMAATLIACGIDPEKCIFYQQSQVPEHGNLSWILSCLTSMPKLSALPQFKEKSAKFTNKPVPTGLYIYPVLQAADIMLYKGTHVPVGSDQLQNINLCKTISRLFNTRYGNIFPVPEALLLDDSLARIKSLKDPSIKMSKSEVNPLGRLDILDGPEDIRKKIKKAVTDFTSEIYFDCESRPGVSNLMTIHSALSGKTMEQITNECRDLDTGKYKSLLSGVTIEYFEPIRRETLKMLDDPGYVADVLKRGCDKARERAVATMEEVYDKMGLKLA